MSDLAIEVLNLSKCYKVFHSPKAMVLDFLGFKGKAGHKWALRNISFEIKKGDVVGVLGRNGAGKSTLLKIISGIIPPTEGEVKVNGKISSILELGTGFHPEYSGRDNIIMGGMCLGMSKEEILSKMDSIIEFSELRAYIDNPFKTYSSGMQSRLTFATAISVEPDILIIDEALAAGDGFFVNKCLKRIKEICSSGATVFFVSHSTDLVRRLCTKAILIKDGHLEVQGDAITTCGYYDSLVLEAASQAGKLSSKISGGNKIDTEVMQISYVRVLNSLGDECNAYFQGSAFTVEVKVISSIEYDNPGLWIKFMRSDGVLATSWFSLEPHVYSGKIVPGANIIKFDINEILLGDGLYYIGVGIFPFKEGAESAFFNDPFCILDSGCELAIQRRGRPLSTVFDQPMTVQVLKESVCVD
jgi:lipopolysaccharide transport system ATP-binding protein